MHPTRLFNSNLLISPATVELLLIICRNFAFKVTALSEQVLTIIQQTDKCVFRIMISQVLSIVCLADDVPVAMFRLVIASSELFYKEHMYFKSVFKSVLGSFGSKSTCIISTDLYCMYFSLKCKR